MNFCDNTTLEEVHVKYITEISRASASGSKTSRVTRAFHTCTVAYII